MKKYFAILLLIFSGLWGENIYATFTVKALQSANLAFNAGGIVEAIHADIGDRVHKGDTLASLRSDDLRAALRIATVAERYAKKEYDRLQSVKEVTDQAKLDGVTFKYENAKAQRAYKEALLAKTILKAPFEGTIVARRLEIGDTFNAMRPVSVLSLQSTHARKLILSFDQKYWHRVHAGQTFTYTVDGDPNPRKGRITKVYPAIDPQSRKMQAEVPARDIPVGLFGEGSILLTEPAE